MSNDEELQLITKNTHHKDTTVVSDSTAIRDVAAAFERHYLKQRFTLPETNVLARRRGTLQQDGWIIQYLFGANERGEFVDVYSFHRMPGSAHWRFYGSGDPVALSYLMTGYCFDSKIPGDQERQKAARDEHNKVVAAELAAKGFCLTMNDALSVPPASVKSVSHE